MVVRKGVIQMTVQEGQKRRRKRRESLSVYQMVVVIMLFVGSIILVDKGYELWVLHLDMEQTLQQEAELQKEQDLLTQRKDQLMSSTEVAEEARQQFGLVKPGEIPYKR